MRSTNQRRELRHLILLANSLCLLMLIGGCATVLSNATYNDVNPPLYLSGVLDAEPELSKIEIEHVIPNSPAEKAGLKPSDEVIALDGENLNKSPRKFYNVLSTLYAKQARDMEIKVKREGDLGIHIYNLEFQHDPGIVYKLTLKDGSELKNVQYVKDEVSGEGFRHDTLYDFKGRVRISEKCHLWGPDLLVIELDISNDHTKKNVHIDPKDIVVKDRLGEVLKPLQTDAVIEKIYDIGSINSVLSSPIYLRKKKAREVSSEMNALHMELNTHKLKISDIPPQGHAYGALVYPFNQWQSLITIETQIGNEKFTSKFELRQNFYDYNRDAKASETEW